MDSRFQSTAVIIPAYNAASTLPLLFERLQRFVKPKNIVVVDDGSRDGTGAIAREQGVTVLEHTANRGKGAALRTGFEFAIKQPLFEFVATMDADLQHRPEELPSFAEARELTGADIVVGWRPRLGTKMPVHRRASNALTSALVSLRTGTAIKDSQCGYRLIRRAVIEDVRTESNGYEAETELLIKAAARGYRIEFVPIQTVYGNEKSFMTNWDTTVKFIKVLFKEY